MNILILLASILFVIYTAMIDHEHINKSEYILSHTSRFFQRLSVFLLVFICNHVYGLIFGLTFALLFDSILNLSITRDWNYLGTVSEYDRFLSKYKFLFYLYKIILLITLTYIIYAY
jgi:MFS superfamily sulfate permease-like transporter